MKYSESRIYKLSKTVYEFAKKTAKPYSSKFSKRTFTQPQHIAINCLKRKINEDYRDMEALIAEMPRIQEVLELKEIPDFTTIKKAFDRLSTHVFVVLLVLTASVFEQSGICGADSTGFPRSYASRHYTKRCKMKLESLKVTFIVDIHTQCIVGVHITVTRKHDTQIILCLVKRVKGRAEIKVLMADKVMTVLRYAGN